MTTLSKKLGNTDFLALQVQSSKILTILVVMIYLVGFISIGILTSSTKWVLFFWILLFVHAKMTIQNECQRNSPKSIVSCESISPHFWQLTTRAGKKHTAKLIAHFRSPWLVILTFELYPKRNTLRLTLPYDAVFKENYLKLLYKLW